jgi:hypothetical protein
VRLRAKSYLHPVLSPYSDDLPGKIFEVDFQDRLLEPIPGQPQSLEIDYQVTCDVRSFTDGLIDQRLKVLFDVHCPQSMYRRATLTTDLAGTITVPAGRAIGVISILPSLVVVDGSQPFTIDEAHGDYKSKTFRLQNGDPVAVHPGYIVPVEPLRRSSDGFLRVVRTDMPAHKYSVYVDTDGVRIHMGSQQFEQYSELKASPDLRKFLFAGVLKDAVVAALEYISEDANEGVSWVENFRSELSRRSARANLSNAHFNEFNEIALDLLHGRK